MQRRISPFRWSDSILLYGFGLALALSLSFNGFLLYEQSHQRNVYEDELSSSVYRVDHLAWQQQLLDCKQANKQKDSLIRRLEQSPNAPPGKAVAVQRTSPK